MYLLDTDSCILALNGCDQGIKKKLLQIHPDEIQISSVTVGELEYGATKQQFGKSARERLRMFLANYRIVPFNEEDAILSGRMRARLEAAGKPIGVYDMMVAVQAMVRGMVFVTCHPEAFPEMPELQIEDWAPG